MVHVSFLLSALNTAKRDQNIVLGYVYPNFQEEMRNKVYPSKSKFNYIKLEFKGGLNYIGVLASYSTISTWQLKLRGDNVNNVIYEPSHPYRPGHPSSAATGLSRCERLPKIISVFKIGRTGFTKRTKIKWVLIWLVPLFSLHSL